MITPGFQRLVLLNSAGYQRSELPLDDAVSLIAPNNTGKTSLINALQFLLIIDRRRMDFGSHDWTITRRFYFPDNSAYILLEVLLPQTGTVVLGCVGKGISHEYEYFAYQGDLKVEDYCRDDGKLVQQPQLIEHLAGKGRTVYRYDSRDFAKLVYGGQLDSVNNSPDFTVFRLEKSSDAKVFQQVLTRTLRLDQLNSSKVKEYLQKIFRHDLYDLQVDFKEEWDKAFHGVNADRAQYLAAETQIEAIQELENARDNRLAVRGQLIDWQARINDSLTHWQSHYDNQRNKIQQHIEALTEQKNRFLTEYQTLITRQHDSRQQQTELARLDDEQQILENRFALVAERGRPLLASQLEEAQQRLDDLTVLLRQTEGRQPEAIKRDLHHWQSSINRLEKQLAHGNDNLYQQLTDALPANQLARLDRILSRDALLLNPAQAGLEIHQLQAELANSSDEQLQLGGMTFQLAQLPHQYQQLSREELENQLKDAKQQADSLKKQHEAACSRQQRMQQKAEQAKAVKSLESDILAFDRMTDLQENATERHAHLIELAAVLDELQQQLANARNNDAQLGKELETAHQQLHTLEDRHRRIVQLREERIDQGTPFDWLPDLPHTPWLGETDWPIDELADRLQTYQQRCRQLLNLNQLIRTTLTAIQANGLTKFQYNGNEDNQLDRIIDFSHQLPSEKEALEKQARSAVVNVTGSLRNLRDNLYALQTCLRDFNRQIGRRQLSDLKTFRIDAVDETPLVEAIDLLIEKAEQVESGDNFTLFNQKSLLDDSKLENAKQRLIDEGEARQGLRVGDLFRLEFALGKMGQKVESFEDIDSAASNGTVLMAKLVTGLAMLYQMQDKRTPFRAICYLDEALALDSANQKSLIATAAEFGYALIFASPAPLTTARYCVPIHQQDGKNHIHRDSWQILQPLNDGTTA